MQNKDWGEGEWQFEENEKIWNDVVTGYKSKSDRYFMLYILDVHVN